jgi:hypothetical protein
MANIKIAFDKDHKISAKTRYGDYFQVRVTLVDSFDRTFLGMVMVTVFLIPNG